MTDGRTRTARALALATLCIATLGISLVGAAPSTADPSVDDARDRLETQYHEAEDRLQVLQEDLDRQRERAEDVREQVASNVVARYQGQALSTASQVVVSGDPEAFLSQLTTLGEYSSQQAQVVEELAVDVGWLEMREEVAQREVDTIERTREVLAIAETPASGGAAATVQCALARADVALPHSSTAQAGSGTPVALSALQPGDLVFYYSPVSHVGIYIANGQIVHASNPSQPVNVAPVSSMPVSGAVRPG